jgi:hypothetical protein
MNRFASSDDMADLAIHPPVHVTPHPDEPIRSVHAAAQFIRRHSAEQLDQTSLELVRRLESANDERSAELAGRAFAQWAQERGLLVAPPVDTRP